MNKNYQLLTEKECAAYLKISIKKLQKDRYNQMGIPYLKIGGSVRYQEIDIIDYLNKNRVQPTLH